MVPDGNTSYYTNQVNISHCDIKEDFHKLYLPAVCVVGDVDAAGVEVVPRLLLPQVGEAHLLRRPRGGRNGLRRGLRTSGGLTTAHPDRHLPATAAALLLHLLQLAVVHELAGGRRRNRAPRVRLHLLVGVPPEQVQVVLRAANR